MNVFVGGIHGVGKTYLASRAAPMLGMLHVSASRLITEERATENWGADKRVFDIDGNQIALAAAVRRRNSAGQKLLLDGHFVLLDRGGQMTPIDAAVFNTLGLDGALLLETDAQTVVDRLQARGGPRGTLEQVREFMAAERTQAENICNALQIKLAVLSTSSVEEFAATLSTLVGP
jgi:adenylate kinase